MASREGSVVVRSAAAGWERYTNGGVLAAAVAALARRVERGSVVLVKAMLLASRGGLSSPGQTQTVE